jgi:hypothetical protein
MIISHKHISKTSYTREHVPAIKFLFVRSIHVLLSHGYTHTCALTRTHACTAAGSRQQAASSRQQAAGSRQQAAGSSVPATEFLFVCYMKAVCGGIESWTLSIGHQGFWRGTDISE